MQFRRQCRLRDIPFFRSAAALRPVVSSPLQVRGAFAWARRGFATLIIGIALAGPASAAAPPLRLAQLGPNGGPGPSYGYQPYNDRNPTGFYHPGGMGYGHYYLTQKHHAPRFRAFRYRKFRGT